MPCPPISAREIPLKTFHRNVFKIKVLQTGHRAERSCSLRPRKAVAFLTHLLRVPRSMGTGNFAVCGQRLRGHVPSKNTSPAALSWSSLICQLDEICSVSAHIRFLFRTTIIFSAQQKSSATSRISSARGGASLFSLSCPAQAQRSGLTSSCVRSSVWLRLQLQTLPVRWEPEQLQTHPWFSACC